MVEYFDARVLGSRLLSLRTALNLTQEQMAEDLGVSRHSILNYEKGKKVPPRKFILSLVKTYNMSEEWFLHGYEPMFPPPHKGSTYDARKDKPFLLELSMPEPVENAAPESQINIKDLTYKTIEILESSTIYRAALASNINAFHHSIRMAEELATIKSRMDTFEASEQQTKTQLHELAQLIKGLQEENKLLKQRRSSEEDPHIIGASSRTDRPSSRKTE